MIKLTNEELAEINGILELYKSPDPESQALAKSFIQSTSWYKRLVSKNIYVLSKDGSSNYNRAYPIESVYTLNLYRKIRRDVLEYIVGKSKNVELFRAVKLKFTNDEIEEIESNLDTYQDLDWENERQIMHKIQHSKWRKRLVREKVCFLPTRKDTPRFLNQAFKVNTHYFNEICPSYTWGIEEDLLKSFLFNNSDIIMLRKYD